jgi:glycosyltransferase involved in cell wall biosynthesis
VFVLPSLNEGISNVILEAMASGLPVIATAVGGNGELVEHGITGTLVPPSDPRALAGAVRDYLQAPHRLMQHGIAARATAERRFSMESMLEGYMSMYESLLQPRHAPCAA